MRLFQGMSEEMTIAFISGTVITVDFVQPMAKQPHGASARPMADTGRKAKIHRSFSNRMQREFSGARLVQHKLRSHNYRKG